MSSSRRGVTIPKCSIWIYGPQVSEKNGGVYGVGGATWKALYNGCANTVVYSKYGKLTPEYIVACVTNKGSRELTKETINLAINGCEDILDVLLIHSAFINALGILNSQDLINTAHRDKLYKLHADLYNATETIVEDKDMKIFVNNEQFQNLMSSRSYRPKNIYSSTILDKYKLVKQNSTTVKHPISKELLKCAVDIKTDCTLRFANIKDNIFEPLAKVISCNCSFFKQKLEKIPSTTDETFQNVKNIHKLSVADYTYFKNSYKTSNPSTKPLILIKKYTYAGTVCREKTYLSQLFEKTCPILFKPHVIIPKTNSKKDIEDAARDNATILQHGCNGWYFDGNLSVFKTPILHMNDHRQKANIGVIFISADDDQQEKIYLDFYSGPSVQFFTDVMKELVEHEVFKPTETFFNNQRYELNTKFDIEKLQCFRRLPAELKKELKKELTEQFFLFVGNLIHFAVVNNIELPFKLSRIYIMKLFNLFDFTSPPKLEEQLLLISIYLLEKAAPIYTNAILKIFADPTVLLTDEKIIQMLDINLTDESQEEQDKGIRMNGLTELVEKDFPLYSEDASTLFYNMIDYLYKTALKHYFDDLNSPKVEFKTNPQLELFFKGFSTVKEYETGEEKTMPTADFSKLNFQQKMGVIRKADLFLSGFGITHEGIRDTFLPRILMAGLDAATWTSPLSLFNTTGTFKNEYIPNTSLDGSESSILTSKLAQLDRGISKNVRMMFFLFRILLNKGKDISKEFIAQYNQQFFNIPYNISTTQRYDNMSDEDYHNEFVKLLLKAWSVTPAISIKDYKIAFYSLNRLPQAHTCFIRLDINKDYQTAREMYKDLVLFVTEGTGFGEQLTGGKRKKK